MPDETPTNTPDDSPADVPDVEQSAGESAQEEQDAPKASAAETLAADALAAAEKAVAEIGADANAGSADEAINAAQQAVSGIAKGEVSPVSIPSLQKDSSGISAAEGIDLLSDVNLSVKIELGRTKMFLEDVLRLSSGSVVELDKLAGDPVDVYVNERHVARGEVLILNDNFCVRINEIIAGAEMEAAKVG